jgi:gluconolactonase
MKRILFLVIGISGLLVTYSCNNTEEPLIDKEVKPEVISEGYRFAEGPYWHEDGFLLYSDIPENRVYKWMPGEGAEVFIAPSGNANGIKADTNGSIILAQHAGKLSMLNDNGELEVLVDNYKGKRLNSPNDLVVLSDNTIYFTDPPYGVREENRELDFSGIYRLSPGRELTLVYDKLSRPNGIALSPDETKLYVNESENGNIFVFDLQEEGRISDPTFFASVGPRAEAPAAVRDTMRFEVEGITYNLLGGADGMITDKAGRVYITSSAGLTIFDQNGHHLQDISFDHRLTNFAWGGPDHNILYITSPKRIYRLQLNTEGKK